MSRIVDIEKLGCLIWKDGEHGTTFDDGVLWVLEKIDELPAIQTCEDAVSRQAAIDLFPNDALEWDTNDGYVAPHLVRRMIKELPSAQSKDAVNKSKLVETIKHCMQYPDGLNRLLAIYEGDQND